MIRSLGKTFRRAQRFLTASMLWRGDERPYAIVSWSLIGGLIWAGVHLPGGQPADLGMFLVRVMLLALLIAVCAIDARFGIIPDGLVWALLIIGVINAWLVAASDGLSMRDWITGAAMNFDDSAASLAKLAFDIVIVFAAAALLRIFYRVVRGHDGLGFGDVKFVAAASLWTGLAFVPVILLAAVVSALASIAILRSEGYIMGRGDAIAFGPHLALGVWLAVLAADGLRL